MISIKKVTEKKPIPIKAALADRKKVVKTGSIFIDRGMGRGSAEASWRGMGKGSAKVRLRGMGSAGARLRGLGRGSLGAGLRGLGRGSSGVK